MHASKLLTATCALALSLVLIAPVTSALAEQPGQPSTAASHEKLTGVISKIRSGVIFVKTPVGQVSFGSKFAAKGGLADAQVGDEVTMWVNENNIVIDVHKKGETEPVHRLVTGNLTYTSDLKTEIKLWTPQGEKTFSVERGKSKLPAIKEGEPVTVELNKAGEVIDIHRLKLSIQATPSAGQRAGSRMKLAGEVTKIKSGMVFVKTPASEVRFGAEMGMKDLKVGDAVIMEINENNVVIGVHKKGEPTPVHRFITGNLVYASDQKTEVKLWTPEGEKTFSVVRGKSKLSPIKEGALITVELNEAGQVIDVRKAG